MRTVILGGVFAILAFALSACGGSSGNSASDRALERTADTYAISQIERDFHKALSKKDIDMMMRLWAPHATFTASDVYMPVTPTAVLAIEYQNATKDNVSVVQIMQAVRESGDTIALAPYCLTEKGEQLRKEKMQSQ